MELTASPETALISYAQGRYRIVRPLKYGKETEQLIFKFKTAMKVGSSDLCSKEYLFIKH